MAQSGGTWIPRTPQLLHHTLVILVARIGTGATSGGSESQWIKHQLQAITSLELDRGESGLSCEEVQGALRYLDGLPFRTRPAGSHLVGVLHQQRADLLTYFKQHGYQDNSRTSQVHWLGEHIGAIEPMLKAWHCLCPYRASMGSGLLNLRREKFYPEFSDITQRHVFPKLQVIHTLLAHLHTSTPSNIQLLLKNSASSSLKPKRSR